MYTVGMPVQFIDMETGEISDTDPRTPILRRAPKREYQRKIPRGYRIALWWSLWLCVIAFFLYAVPMWMSL